MGSYAVRTRHHHRNRHVDMGDLVPAVTYVILSVAGDTPSSEWPPNRILHHDTSEGSHLEPSCKGKFTHSSREEAQITITQRLPKGRQARIVCIGREHGR